MRIAGVASAFPRQYFRQEEITAALRERWADKLGNPDVLDRLLSRVGVESRHLALPIEAYDGLTSWGKANDAWIAVSEELAEQALCRALSRAWPTVRTPTLFATKRAWSIPTATSITFIFRSSSRV